jgi:hypothetical protein
VSPKTATHWVDSDPVVEPEQHFQPFLTDGRPIGAAGYRVLQYLPLAEFPGPFRVFAETEPSHDGVKAFADRFGPLGGDIAKQIPLYDQPNAQGTPMGFGEPLAAWTNEILMVRFAIDIWDAARNGDVSRLERVIFWTEDGSGVQILSHPELPNGQLPHAPARVERAWIAATHLGDGVLERFVPGDLINPALHYVQSTINEKLEGRAFPRLLWDAKRERLCLYRAGRVDRRAVAAVRPGSGARQPVPAVRRMLHVVRARARHRARRQTLLLHALSHPSLSQAPGRGGAPARRGRSLDDIARALESDPDTVRGWIEQKRGSGGSPQSETG